MEELDIPLRFVKNCLNKGPGAKPALVDRNLCREELLVYDRKRIRRSQNKTTVEQPPQQQ